MSTRVRHASALSCSFPDISNKLITFGRCFVFFKVAFDIIRFINNIQIIHHHDFIFPPTFGGVFPRALPAGPPGLDPAAGRPQVTQLAVVDVAQE